MSKEINNDRHFAYTAVDDKGEATMEDNSLVKSSF
jgi:hypothetical protein